MSSSSGRRAAVFLRPCRHVLGPVLWADTGGLNLPPLFNKARVALGPSISGHLGIWKSK